MIEDLDFLNSNRLFSFSVIPLLFPRNSITSSLHPPLLPDPTSSFSHRSSHRSNFWRPYVPNRREVSPHSGLTPNTWVPCTMSSTPRRGRDVWSLPLLKDLFCLPYNPFFVFVFRFPTLLRHIFSCIYRLHWFFLFLCILIGQVTRDGCL